MYYSHLDDIFLQKSEGTSILDPVQNASAAPVMEIHPALGVIWDDYDPFYYRKH